MEVQYVSNGLGVEVRPFDFDLFGTPFLCRESGKWETCKQRRSNTIEHVINMGSVDDFVEVAPGEKRFNIQTKKFQCLRYVPPTYRVVPEHFDGGKQMLTGKGKTVQRSATAGYWMVIFENESKP